MPTPPGFANVSAQLTLAGLARPAYVTFGINPTDTSPQIVANKVLISMTSAGSFMSRMDSSVTLSQIRVSLGTDGSEDLVGQVTGTTVGSIAGGGTPPQVAVLLHKVTTRGGRRGRGRMFIPWWAPETNVDEAGLIDTSILDDLQAAADNFLAALLTNGVPMYLLHDPGKTAEGPPNEVLGLTVDRLTSTQRRRLGRR
jgi:hypothetical protein